ncbi:MAG: DUF1194 domain-containing protein [Pseudomonadota bacterium]
MRSNALPLATVLAVFAALTAPAHGSTAVTKPASETETTDVANANPSCRLALLLALDISNSVDPQEQRLQTRGLASALVSDEVIAAILNGGGAVSAAAFSWSNARTQINVAPWTLLDSEAAIRQFAARVAATPPDRFGRSTALGKALSYAAWMHSRNPYRCDSKVVDVSGDGVNNDGAPPIYFRKLGRLRDLTINGLVIRNDRPDPYAYFYEQVIQGPGAFVIDIDDYYDYADAMKRKLIRELSPMFAYNGFE